MFQKKYYSVQQKLVLNGGKLLLSFLWRIYVMMICRCIFLCNENMTRLSWSLFPPASLKVGQWKSCGFYGWYVDIILPHVQLPNHMQSLQSRCTSISQGSVPSSKQLMFPSLNFLSSASISRSFLFDELNHASKVMKFHGLTLNFNQNLLYPELQKFGEIFKIEHFILS